MPVITVPAARVKQGSLTLYATSFAVKDLLGPGFYSVEKLDPSGTSESGYQRVLNIARAKKLADYVLNGIENQDAFLPTSVFLATDRIVEFDQRTNSITFRTEDVGPFSVVDGQHRLEGLRLAAERDARVMAFEVAVNIAVGLPKIAQMCHFLIVNTTQKSVDKSVEQRIMARLTEALDFEDVPSLPKWILNTVKRGEVDKAVRYVDFLNTEKASPWCGKIQMANTDREDATINQRTFVKLLVKYMITANNPLQAFNDFEKEKRVLLNYWRAIVETIGVEDGSVLYKYVGVDLFSRFSLPFFMKLQDRADFKVSTMKDLLKRCLDGMDGENAGVGHEEWWRSGANASRLNASAVGQIAQQMTASLHKSTQVGEVEI